MNIISYNVRGLGRGVKWGAIRRLVKHEGVDMICLQETKKELVDKAMCQALWGHVDVSWELLPAKGGVVDKSGAFAPTHPQFVMRNSDLHSSCSRETK